MSTNHRIDLSALDDRRALAIDPVCKMSVDTEDEGPQASYGGRTYHFCGDECADLFRMSPESYVPRTAQA